MAKKKQIKSIKPVKKGENQQKLPPEMEKKLKSELDKK